MLLVGHEFQVSDHLLSPFRLNWPSYRFYLLDYTVILTLILHSSLHHDRKQISIPLLPCLAPPWPLSTTFLLQPRCTFKIRSQHVFQVFNFRNPFEFADSFERRSDLRVFELPHVLYVHARRDPQLSELGKLLMPDVWMLRPVYFVFDGWLERVLSDGDESISADWVEISVCQDWTWSFQEGLSVLFLGGLLGWGAGSGKFEFLLGRERGALEIFGFSFENLEFGWV